MSTYKDEVEVRAGLNNVLHVTSYNSSMNIASAYISGQSYRQPVIAPYLSIPTKQFGICHYCKREYEGDECPGCGANQKDKRWFI